jgi:hypothetical protein
LRAWIWADGSDTPELVSLWVRHTSSVVAGMSSRSASKPSPNGASSLAGRPAQLSRKFVETLGERAVHQVKRFVAGAVLDDPFPHFGGRAGKQDGVRGRHVQQGPQLLVGVLVEGPELLAPVRNGAQLLPYGHAEVLFKGGVQLRRSRRKEDFLCHGTLYFGAKLTYFPLWEGEWAERFRAVMSTTPPMMMAAASADRPVTGSLSTRAPSNRATTGFT